jgi:hypothetical protein
MTTADRLPPRALPRLYLDHRACVVALALLFVAAVMYGAPLVTVPADRAMPMDMWAASALLVSFGTRAWCIAVALATLDGALVVAPALRPRLARSRPAA